MREPQRAPAACFQWEKVCATASVDDTSNMAVLLS